MNRRVRKLGFISLSILSLLWQSEALAANPVPTSVEKLRMEAVELERNEEKDEAVERMKDAICLAELLKTPIEDEIAFLLKTADVNSLSNSPAPTMHLAWQAGTIQRYCYGEILKKIPIKTFDDVSIIAKVWGRTEDPSAADIDRLRGSISALHAESREQKRLQVKVLVQLNSKEPRSGKYLAKALELSKQLDPPDIGLQKEVLDKILSPSYGPIEPEYLKLLRVALEDAFEISQKVKDYPSTDAALNTLMVHEGLAGLVSFCEKQAAATKKWYPQQPQYLAPHYLYTGWAYLATGRNQDAQKLFEEVSRLTKLQNDSDYFYECAELSLAKVEMVLGQQSKAKTRLLELRKIFDSPSRADLFHYGAIGEALLGEIYENEGDLDSARACYEKADPGLMVMANNGSSYELLGFRAIKKMLPDDALVLSRLANIYARLNLPDKQKITEEHLLALQKTATDEVKSRRDAELQRKTINSCYFPKSVVLSALNEYKGSVESTETDQTKLADRLNRVAVQCLARGLPDQADDFSKRAALIDPEPRPGLREIAKRNQAWALAMRKEYSQSNKLLNELTASSSTSTDEQLLSQWLYSKNLMSQFFTKQAASDLETIIQSWSPNASYRYFYLQACCDQAQLFIQQKKLQEAETSLKNCLSSPSTRVGTEYIEGFSSTRYPLALLAKVQALLHKTAESKLNFSAASKPDRNYPEFGIQTAVTCQTLADAILALKDENRARRLYFEAYQKFKELDYFQQQAQECKAQVQKLLPVGTSVE